MLINIAVGEKRERSNYRFVYCLLVYICTKGCRNYCKKLYDIQWGAGHLTECCSVLLYGLLKLTKKTATQEVYSLCGRYIWKVILEDQDFRYWL